MAYKKRLKVVSDDDATLIKKMKVGLLSKWGAMGLLLGHSPVSMSQRVNTAATDGKRIYFNKDFFTALSLEERVGVLCHELLHKYLLHVARMEGKDLRVWNMACDYALNPLIISAGMKLPGDALIDDAFTGMSAEAIYEILKKKQKKSGNGDGEGSENQTTTGNGRWDFSTSDHFLPLASDAESEAICKARLQQAASLPSTAAGKEACDMLRKMLGEIMQPHKLPWKVLLRNWMTASARDDRSFRKPSRRQFLYGNITRLPVNLGYGLPDLYIIFDTSGSIDDEALKEFLTETHGILTEVKPQSVTLVCTDTEVQSAETLCSIEELLSFEPVGGGGTHFGEVMEYLASSTGIAIMFTDTQTCSWGADPEMPIMFVGYGGAYREPPFGSFIELTK